MSNRDKALLKCLEALTSMVSIIAAAFGSLGYMSEKEASSFERAYGRYTAAHIDLIDPVCELDLDFSMENIKCSACNKAISHGTNPLEMKYCPNCGARVVSCND